MRFASLYRASMYVTLVLATLIVNIDMAGDNPLSPFYPLAMAAAAALAFVTVDRDPRLGISRDLADPLAWASVALALLEYWVNPDLLVLALGHWMAYLQLIWLFQPKTTRDDWWLMLLALVQVVVGVFQSQSDRVGALLMLWFLAALWTLRLFYLRREAVRRGALPAVENRDQSRDRPEPYPGLLDGPFLLSAARVALTSLLLGTLIFLLLPRGRGLSQARKGLPLSSHLTGFTDEVRLGQLGEILENDSIVMSVMFYDSTGDRTGPPEEPRWRGVTLIGYEDRRWRRGSQQLGNLGPAAAQGQASLRQAITLEPTDSQALFALRPIVSSRSFNRNDPVLFNWADGSIYRYNASDGPYRYEVWSDEEAMRSGRTVQVGEPFPGEEPDKKLGKLTGDYASLGIPRLLEIRDEAMAARLEAFALKVLDQRGLPPRRPGDDPDERTRVARALETYFSTSGLFRYSLRMARGDARLDPVEDFLYSRREGHCEYFASALTLLLRSLGIPARMVNGFKGGDWNELGGILYVRQKHAHSWVEALLGRDADGRPVWLTLDPTPAAQREQLVESIGLDHRVRSALDFINYLWVFYVVGYNNERQRRLLYEPLQTLWREILAGFAQLWALGRAATAWVFHFPSVGSFFSVRGFLVSVAAMLLLAGLAALGRRLARRLLRSWRGHGADDEAVPAGVAFYRRLAELLGEQGLSRPPAETPREFAARASTFLAGRPDAHALADVPGLVVDAFYGVRFGRLSLPEPVLRGLEERLDALEAGLRGPADGRPA